MFLGELSDMVGIQHKRARDPDPLFIMVMQITTGKFEKADCCCCCFGD